jgi:hypothetical protein
MSTGTVAVAGGGAMPISAKGGMIADIMFLERKFRLRGDWLCQLSTDL